MVASMQDLVTVVMNPDSEFQNLLARTSSLPGLLQRLEEINLRGKEVKFEDVKDFDDIGNCPKCSKLTPRNGVMERHHSAQKTRRGQSGEATWTTYTDRQKLFNSSSLYGLFDD